MEKMLPLIVLLILLFTGTMGYTANLVDIPISKVATLYKWQGEDSGGIRIHLDSKSRYDSYVVKDLASKLIRLKKEMATYVSVEAPKSIDIFLAPSKANLGGPYLFKEKWTILSGFDPNIKNGFYFHILRSLVQLYLVNGTGSSMKIHPYVLEGMGTLLTDRFLQGRGLTEGEHRKTKGLETVANLSRAGNYTTSGKSSTLKKSSSINYPLNVSPHKFLAGRLLSDEHSLRLILSTEDMILAGELQKMKCASFFAFIDEFLPQNKFSQLAKKSAVPGVSKASLLPRFSKAIYDATGKSLSTLIVGWKEVLSHTIPDLEKEHVLYRSVGRKLSQQGETLAVLMPYRLHPRPEFAATCESGEIYRFSCDLSGKDLTLVSRLRKKQATFKPLSMSAFDNAYSAPDSSKRNARNKDRMQIFSPPSRKKLNAFFEDRVRAANEGREDDLYKSFETAGSSFNNVGHVDSKKFVCQLRKLSVESISSESLYLVNYVVDLGKANGIEKRRAGFVFRNNKWLLVSDVVR